MADPRAPISVLEQVFAAYAALDAEAGGGDGAARAAATIVRAAASLLAAVRAPTALVDDGDRARAQEHLESLAKEAKLAFRRAPALGLPGPNGQRETLGDLLVLDRAEAVRDLLAEARKAGKDPGSRSTHLSMLVVRARQYAQILGIDPSRFAEERDGALTEWPTQATLLALLDQHGRDSAGGLLPLYDERLVVALLERGGLPRKKAQEAVANALKSGDAPPRRGRQRKL